MVRKEAAYEVFQLAGRQTPRRGVSATADEAVRDVVANAPALPDRMGRGQPIPGLIAELAAQG